jgi:hypothetical protein
LKDHPEDLRQVASALCRFLADFQKEVFPDGALEE